LRSENDLTVGSHPRMTHRAAIERDLDHALFSDDVSEDPTLSPKERTGGLCD
jgi:hypothetical protein